MRSWYLRRMQILCKQFKAFIVLLCLLCVFNQYYLGNRNKNVFAEDEYLLVLLWFLFLIDIILVCLLFRDAMSMYIIVSNFGNPSRFKHAIAILTNCFNYICVIIFWSKCRCWLSCSIASSFVCSIIFSNLQ